VEVRFYALIIKLRLSMVAPIVFGRGYFSFTHYSLIARKCLWKMLFVCHIAYRSQNGNVGAMGFSKIAPRALLRLGALQR
jgi:hypothetical protein